MLKSLRPKSALGTVLWADVALELIVAVLCFALAGSAAGWFAVDRVVFYVAGAVFAAAAVAIVPLALKPGANLAAPLGWANIAGGCAAWVVLALAWGTFAAEGRWVLAAVADSFIAVGVLELVAVRRMKETPANEAN